MPLAKIQLKPGLVRDTTTYAGEGGYYTCDKIRFRSGFPEKIGGWKNQNPSETFRGTARSLFNWVPRDSSNLLGVGTSQKYYIQNGRGGTYNDITPIRTTIRLGTDPFDVVTGSRVVTVNATGHEASANTFVTFVNAGGDISVGGLLLASAAGVEFEIVEIIDADSFTISAPAASSSTVSGGGTTIDAVFQINAGGDVFTTGSGWGVGVWGGGGTRGWGTPTTSTQVRQPLRFWTNTNYGEDLVIAVREGPLYFWEVDTSASPARAVALSDETNTRTKVTTTGTSAGAGATITVGDSTLIDIGSVVISGTNIATPGTDYVVSISGNDVTLSAATTGAASGNYVFSYAGMFVPHTVNFVINSGLSYFIIALGANPYDPSDPDTDFDPMLVRWSDQDNVFQWVPSTLNQAGEQRLAYGSYLVTGHVTRQEILVFSDSTLYSMQYLGPPYVFGFTPISQNISIASPQAVVTAGNVQFWMGVDKFYTYSGRVETLPCTLRTHVFGNINRDQLFQVVAGTNEGFNEVWWHYPSADSEVNDSYVVYNYLENIWYYGSLRRTAWLDSPLRPYPTAAYSVQNTYLSQDISASDTTIPVLKSDTYPPSGTVLIDNEEVTYTAIEGGALTGCTRGVSGTTATSHLTYAPVVFTIPNQILDHEFDVDDQTADVPQAIHAFIESSDFDIGDGHNFGFVWRILPDLTFNGSTVDNPQAMLTVKPRVNSGRNYGTADSPTVTRTATFPVEQYTGQVYTRIRGRQMSFRIESTGIGVMWQMGAMRIDIRPDGRKI